MRSAGLALIVALIVPVAVACGPKLVWTGRTPDRVHRIEVIRDGGLDYVVVDGERRAAYRGIAGWSIAFSRDHIAFAARVGRDWVVVHDGRISRERWQGIGELRISDDNRVVYVAERAGGWHVVTGTAVGPRVDAVLARSLALAGPHVAYVAQRGKHVHAIVDGKLGPPFDGIGQLALAGDGRHAYAARSGLDAFVIADGVRGPRCDGVQQLRIGPRGRVAYVATLGDQQHVVIDGEMGATVDSVRHIAFRDDGAHVAWVGRLDNLDVLALDDAPIAAWAARRDPKLAFRPSAAGDGVGLAYVLPGEQGEQVVVDGVGGPFFDEIRTPVWSNDGRLAYAARRGATWSIVSGDRVFAVGDGVGDPVLAGGRIAYVGRRGNRSFVVVDDRMWSFDLVFEDSVTFSADGKRWAAIAGDRTREQLFIVIDGSERIPLAVPELYSAGASGAGESTLRDWTRAELAKAARPAARR